MNKLKTLLKEKNRELLNIFFTAGYPTLNSTIEIGKALDKSGVHLVEIGMPYSDPLADGSTVQDSSQVALANGMNLDILFTQLKELAATTNLTIILMGYLNQLMTYGIENFMRKAKENGVSGLIIPDLPMDIYEKHYKDVFERHAMAISFLISPRTSEERIRMADRLSTGFIYMVSDNSITGKSEEDFSPMQQEYFKRISGMNLKTPQMVGFGIRNKRQLKKVFSFTTGAIIGSEFIRQLAVSEENLQDRIHKFVDSLKM